MSLHNALVIFLILINAAAVLFTIADKRRAIKGKYRISEDFLLTIAFLGGAAAEYITMLIVHHKTKHKKFMIGLPLMVLLHIALAILVLYIQKL